MPIRLIETLLAPHPQFWFFYGLFFMHAAAMAIKERAREPKILILGLIYASIVQIDNVPPVAETIMRMVPYYAIGVVFGPLLLGVRLPSSISLTDWPVLLAQHCAMAISLTSALAKDVPGIWPTDANQLLGTTCLAGLAGPFVAVVFLHRLHLSRITGLA